MRIGIDIDDTISDSCEVSFAYAQKYTIEDLNRIPEISNKPSIHHSYIKEMHNWTQEEEDNFWNKYYKKIIYLIKPYTLACETIDKLKEDGHEIVIITSRWQEKNFDSLQATLNWLKENNVHYDEIEMDVKDKGKMAVNKNIDLFIDDSFKNCLSVAENGIKTFIMNTRTNKGFDSDKITRVYSWPDIYNRIKKEEF